VDRNARLVIAKERIHGLGMCEAEVVHLVYRLSSEERWSCQRIADHLNALGVPTAYARDNRQVGRGKRKQRTAGIWRAGRVRNLIASTTYKGVHVYGKRSRQPRETIERLVPAIVDAETWGRAQETMARNRLFSPRNAKTRYLLRGLIKCGTCGLTYSGTSWTDAKGHKRTYYTCNGVTQHRGLYGQNGERCPSKSVSGWIEDLVWSDIVWFAAHREQAIAEMHRQEDAFEREYAALQQGIAALERKLAGTEGQRERILGLFRRGVIDDGTVEGQLAEIAAEASSLQSELLAKRTAAERSEQRDQLLKDADVALWQLARRLDEVDRPLDWDAKRALVETLVDRIVVQTTVEDGAPVAVAEVSYCFTLAATRTDRDSSPPPG
jgi:site-specific DNA recombinase